MKKRLVLLASLLFGVALTLADEPAAPKPAAALPAFEKMGTLAGAWEGTAAEEGKILPTNARFKFVSDHSALAGWLNEGTPNEMMTMFHPDGPDLIATHYCSAHNQPRMVLLPGGDANRLVFRFRDGTNIAPGAGHMQQVTFILDGPDHHVEEWVFLENGKEGPPARFDFYRKH